MTVYALQRRLASSGITVSSVDPGIVGFLLQYYYILILNIMSPQVKTEVTRGYQDLKAFTFVAKVVLAGMYT